MYSTFDTYNPTKEDLIANAPEGATHYTLEDDDSLFTWVKEQEDGYYYSVHRVDNKVSWVKLYNPCVMFEIPKLKVQVDIDNPITIRERILKIRKEREAGINEEQELIEKLASMGFKLIEDINEKLEEAREQHDLQDWHNWKEGDVVMCQADGQGFSDGSLYTVDCIHPNGINQVKIASDDNGNFNGWCADFFKFMSRPTK